MTPAPPAATARGERLLAVTGVAAVAVPVLIAFNLPPSSTFFNQATAFGLWGLFVAAAAWRVRTDVAAALRATWPLWAVLAAIGAFALAGWLAGPLPVSLVLAPLGVLAAAAVTLVAAAAGAAQPAAVRAFALGLVAAGALSALVALVQVFTPGWADGEWIARSTLPGRAVGNLRQPNHLATLLLWAAIALVPLVDRARGARTVAPAALVWTVLVVATQLTGSRTGLLGVGLLALWGLVDRRLGRRARALLWTAPLLYALAWAVAALAAQQGWGTFGTATRAAQADPSSSRFAIWSDTLALIAAQPWTGVGFERFNFAWTLTPFPQRPVAYFDHTHNLPLQFAVEFGVPAAVALTALLAIALARAWRAARTGRDGVWRRAFVALIVLVGTHSLLEYPLWYAHFLLPAAWAWGACLAPAPGGSDDTAPRRLGLVVAGLAMALAALAATTDYLRVARIFTASAGSAPLAQRIAAGQASPLFGHHADYAAATTAQRPSQALPAFERAAYHLLDARLLGAWARALDEAGDTERARHVAARLREFRRPEAQAFFKDCDAAPAGAPAPFPCAAPTRPLTWRDFER
ncbi:PglL family O-oligosaccharyltransferase [Azohydromonas sediminis]|uniref:PglL family O-oligosaccharyltransferase n=1 Tax=Azohydromonas sediminis TaxID=2259674 RepID=UPI000E654FF0|nr:O-antigen ligase family protein [Azohydromonas sediminis]